MHALHLAPGETGEPIEGVTMHPPPRASSSRLRGAWLAGAGPARRLWLRLEPDLAHSHQVVPCGYLCERAGMRPHVATAWGSEVLMAGSSARRLVTRVAREAELLTADSRHLLDALERAGAEPRAAPLGSLGRQHGLARARARGHPRRGGDDDGLPNERPIVLSHRGTRDIYRQDTFVRAIAELRGGRRGCAG